MDHCYKLKTYHYLIPQRYLRNPDEVFLDSEDEELFLTEEEAQQRRTKIEEICRRMVPPPLKGSEKKTRYRKRH